MNLLIYLLKASACSGIFYLFYFLFLRRLTFFSINRWYLVGALLLSLAVPMLTIPVTAVPEVVVEQAATRFNPVSNTNGLIIVSNSGTKHQHAVTDWPYWLTVGYGIITIVFVLHFSLSIIAFRRKLKGRQLMEVNGVKVFQDESQTGNSSFMNAIFLNTTAITADELNQVLNHELLHIRLLHSADKLFVRIVQIVLWFNPFVYAYLRSVEENHEFEVDRMAARGADKSDYASLLLKLSLAGNHPLYNSFSKQPLKKRITMLFNQPSSNMKKVIYLFIVPVVLISCLAFARFSDNDEHPQNRKPSAVGILNNLGPHPLVLINGKEYPSDILYSISGKCISTTSIKSAGAVSGKEKDGVVQITTNGPVVNMTGIERENLIKEYAVPTGQFYARLRLKNDDGSEYDKVIFQLPSGGKMSSDLKPAEQPAFVVGDKIYKESEMGELEKEVKARGFTSFGTGPASGSYIHPSVKADLKGFKNYFYFAPGGDDVKTSMLDTGRYRQKIKRTSRQEADHHRSVLLSEKFRKSAEYAQKSAAMERINNKELFYTVTGTYTDNSVLGKNSGYKVQNDGYEFHLSTTMEAYKPLAGKLQTGDVIKISSSQAMFAEGQAVIIMPAMITKHGQTIFKLTDDKAISKYAFLYEANKVRFTDGEVTDIQKYANGKWKSATIALQNGYRIRFNLKTGAPDMSTLSNGDQVRFRFVQEKKTGAMEYTVNDWVSISTDIKDYGIKNPDTFYKFYEKA